MPGSVRLRKVHVRGTPGRTPRSSQPRTSAPVCVVPDDSLRFILARGLLRTLLERCTGHSAAHVRFRDPPMHHQPRSARGGLPDVRFMWPTENDGRPRVRVGSKMRASTSSLWCPRTTPGRPEADPSSAAEPEPDWTIAALPRSVLASWAVQGSLPEGPRVGPFDATRSVGRH